MGRSRRTVLRAGGLLRRDGSSCRPAVRHSGGGTCASDGTHAGSCSGSTRSGKWLAGAYSGQLIGSSHCRLPGSGCYGSGLNGPGLRSCRLNGSSLLSRHGSKPGIESGLRRRRRRHGLGGERPRVLPAAGRRSPGNGSITGNSRQGMRQTGPARGGQLTDSCQVGGARERRRVSSVGGGGGHGGRILRRGRSAVGSPAGLLDMPPGTGGGRRVDLGAVGHGTAGIGGGFLCGVSRTLNVLEHCRERRGVRAPVGRRACALLGAALDRRGQRGSQIHAFHDAAPAGTMRRMEVRLECCSQASRIWMVLPGTGASMALPLPR